MSPLRPWLIALVAVLLAATAWAQSSMTPDQAYVRAVSFMQGELNRIEADNRIRHAKAIKDLQCPLCEADGAGAIADAIGIVEQYDPRSALRQIDGQREADRSCADNDHRVVGR